MTTPDRENLQAIGACVDVRPVIMADAPQARQVWLVVGGQSFQVGDGWEEPELAAAYADMLRHALSALAAAQPAEGVEGDARCGECGARLELVRPGKHQHPTCSQHPPAEAAQDCTARDDTPSRSQLKRIAVLKGEPMPRFDEAAQDGGGVDKPTRPGFYKDDEHVHRRGVAECPNCGTKCRTEQVLWSDRHLGTKSRTDYIPLAPADGDNVDDAAQGAVATAEISGIWGWRVWIGDSCIKTMLREQEAHEIASKINAAFAKLTHPQAAPAQGDGEMAKIGRLIETQDNRITEAPIFIVQQKRWICGVDPDYGGERVWINHVRESVEITDEAEIARLDAEYAEEYTAPEGYTLTGKMHVWDFVTACFTEQGCKDYLARDGHNLCEPRIYAAGSYRNEEWRSVRKFLMSLAAAPSQGDG